MLANLSFLAAGALALAGDVPRPDRAVDSLPDRARIVATLDSIAAAPVARGQAAGLVLLVVHGRDTLLARGYGLASREDSTPMRADHVFQLASITKQFTAAAVLRLVEAGHVELDAPITRWVPGAPVQGKVVTVRQLLSHTAGIADYAGLPALRPLSHVDLPSDSVLAYVRDVPFHFAPGTQMRYSNTGFTLAGQLIERVTGVPYARWVEEQVLRPAGLVQTRFCDRKDLAPRASGYAMSPEGLRPARVISPYMPWAAGGFCGTAGDLARWNAALHGGRVLGAAAYAEMMRPGTLRDGRVTRYGLGTSLHAMAGRRAIGHGGDIDGFTTYAARFPDDSLTVVALVNTQGPVRPDAIVTAAANAVLGPAPRTGMTGGATGRTTGAAPALDALAGRYVDDVSIAVVTAPDGARTLQITRGPNRPFPLTHEGGRWFTDGRARYEILPDGMWADMGVAYVWWPRLK